MTDAQLHTIALQRALAWSKGGRLDVPSLRQWRAEMREYVPELGEHTSSMPVAVDNLMQGFRLLLLRRRGDPKLQTPQSALYWPDAPRRS